MLYVITTLPHLKIPTSLLHPLLHFNYHILLDLAPHFHSPPLLIPLRMCLLPQRIVPPIHIALLLNTISLSLILQTMANHRDPLIIPPLIRTNLLTIIQIKAIRNHPGHNRELEKTIQSFQLPNQRKCLGLVYYLQL